MMAILDDYKNWIKRNRSVWYEFSEDEEGNFHLCVNHLKADVTFYHLELLTCELKIMNHEEENLFYLHFELKELSHAQGLYTEMIDALRKLKDKRRVEALLCCSSGLTTSFFTMQLNEASELLAMDISFSADAYANLYDRARDMDVILLAPQIGYMYREVSDILKDKVVIQIPAAVFASYDTGTMLQIVREALEKKKEELAEDPSDNFGIRSGGSWGTCMVIAFYTDYKGLRATYRVFRECDILEERSYIREKWDVSIYEDILDTVLPRFPEITNVYISTPGIVDDGHLSFDYVGIVDVDLQSKYEKKYQRRFNLCNDHNAIAMGYYTDHKEDENLGNFILHYQSYLNHGGGAGIIINDELVYGNHHMAGEIHYMLRALHFSDAYHYLARTPEGQAELTAKQLLPLILAYSPDTAAFCNPMVKDVDAVKSFIAKYLPERLMPRIIKVDDEIENLYWGAMLIGRASIASR